MKPIDWSAEVGKKYGRLTVTEVLKTKKGMHNKLACICDCGNSAIFDAQNVIHGKSRSCGCLRSEASRKQSAKNIKHVEGNTPLYKTWGSMRRRCYDHKNKDYKWYGGKGVTVCDEWKEYVAFRDWAYENGYTHGLTIDRKNASGNYCPENCRWIPLADNSRIAHEHLIAVNGVSMSNRQWENKLGYSHGTISRWAKAGDEYAALKIKESLSQSGDYLPAISAASAKPRDKYLTITGITKNYTDWCKTIGVSRNCVCAWVKKHGEDYAISKIIERLNNN